MGRNYSLKAIFEHSRTANLLSELCRLLTPESASRIAGLTWKPATSAVRKAPSGQEFLSVRGIEGLEPMPFEVGNNYHFQLDAREIQPFYADPAYQQHSRPFAPGSCACLLTSVFGGEGYAILEMTSQFDALSEILENADEIHDLWRGFASESNALAAYVDREEEHAIMVFPEKRTILIPSLFSIPPSDDLHYSIDLLVERILQDNPI